MPSLSEDLVESACSTIHARANALRPAAARTLLDFGACVLGTGSALPEWPPDRAGRLAVAAHRRDRDDLHLGSVTHPGGVVWSAVVATALETDATVQETGEAAALGYELVVRLAEALGPAHRSRWHATTITGTVGAAAAAALLLTRRQDRVAAAVAHALSVAGGSAQALFERTGTRIVHRAHAASAGVACARAAQAGLDASRHNLEGGRGAFAIESPASLIRSPCEVAAIEETGFRLHAVNGFAQAAVDAALAIAPLDPRAIQEVHIAVSPAVAATVASNPQPADDEEAWWSIEHAVAACLTAGDSHGLETGLSTRRDVLALCGRVAVTGEGRGWGARLVVIAQDGTTTTASTDEPRGHRAHPATDDELLAKWAMLAGTDGAPFFNQLLVAAPDAPASSALAPAFASVFERRLP